MRIQPASWIKEIRFLPNYRNKGGNRDEVALEHIIPPNTDSMEVLSPKAETFNGPPKKFDFSWGDRHTHWIFDWTSMIHACVR